jgi:hypothetical protein
MMVITSDDDDNGDDGVDNVGYKDDDGYVF